MLRTTWAVIAGIPLQEYDSAVRRLLRPAIKVSFEYVPNGAVWCGGAVCVVGNHQEHRLNEPADRDTMKVLCSVCGIVAPVAFASVVVIAGALYPGYSHSTQLISELAAVHSPVAVIQTVNSLAMGVLLIPFAWALHAGTIRGRQSVLGSTLIGFFGFAAIAYALLPCDPGGEFVTVTGSIHNAIAICGFLAALTGIFIVSRTLTSDPNWGHKYRLYSMITAAAGLTALILWIVIGSSAPPGLPRFAARVPSMNGILQRVFVGILLQWIEVMAIRLFVVFRHPQIV
jgi:hypothetical membrane protein